jgi:hypothetical protein
VNEIAENYSSTSEPPSRGQKVSAVFYNFDLNTILYGLKPFGVTIISSDLGSIVLGRRLKSCNYETLFLKVWARDKIPNLFSKECGEKINGEKLVGLI